MNKTFKIFFTNNNYYRIVQQPEIDFSCYNIYNNISIHAIAYPDSRPDIIWLRGKQHEADDRYIKIFPKHLKVLEKLCDFKHWRFIICI